MNPHDLSHEINHLAPSWEEFADAVRAAGYPQDVYVSEQQAVRLISQGREKAEIVGPNCVVTPLTTLWVEEA